MSDPSPILSPPPKFQANFGGAMRGAIKTYQFFREVSLFSVMPLK